MAQFDVHRNPGRHADTIPYVVDVQSAQFDDYRRRVVVPLVRAGNLGSTPFPAFNPSFRIRGVKVILHPLEMVSVPVEQLGPPVGSLVDDGQAIISALDELFSRAWQ
ncbi:MAG TPA: CcdB family protein [Steroidobacteraceae bacterium]|nr:CcdB family protein [Steroidobacteraceae bacterium]HRX88304.1 CcdB family protein [Steroidobacteraceae bacterium]